MDEIFELSEEAELLNSQWKYLLHMKEGAEKNIRSDPNMTNELKARYAELITGISLCTRAISNVLYDVLKKDHKRTNTDLTFGEWSEELRKRRKQKQLKQTYEN